MKAHYQMKASLSKWWTYISCDRHQSLFLCLSCPRISVALSCTLSVPVSTASTPQNVPSTHILFFPVHISKVFSSHFPSGTHNDLQFHPPCLWWHLPAPACLPASTFRSLFQRNCRLLELLACASSLPLHTSPHLLNPFDLDSSVSSLNLLSWRSQIQWSLF